MIEQQETELEEELVALDSEEDEPEFLDPVMQPFNPADIDIVVEPKSLDALIKRIQHKEIDMNTRFNKRAQLIRTEAEEGGTASLTFDALLLFFLLLGIISERSFAFGASTPWKRMRLSLGRGTSAANRCMNSSGDRTMWVVPSR